MATYIGGRWFCNGVLQQLQEPWVSATLHENFEKCPFFILGVIDDADFNGGSLTVLRLQFREKFNLATSCNIFATSATISKFCIQGFSDLLN